MKNVSDEYKIKINEALRPHAYMRVSLGVINQEAQADAEVEGDFTWYSEPDNVISGEEITAQYASLEQNYWIADGTMLFLPETEGGYTLPQGAITEDLLGSVTVVFEKPYDIKGFTIDFGEYYPTEFTITAGDVTRTYENTTGQFLTTDAWFGVESVIITPISMVGGQQRLRINSFLCGMGVLFTNSEIGNASLESYAHTVSEELPYQTFKLKILDKAHTYNVDENTSIINFLETGQPVLIRAGLELSDSIEWLDMASLYLTDWSSTRGEMNFTAKDRFQFLKDKYSASNKIYTRTLYDEAISVLTAAGLEADEYDVDEFLGDIEITAPLPIMTYAQALQVIANAGRCLLYQNTSGQIIFRANFANVIEPEDIGISASGAAAYSDIDSVKIGSSVIYADLTQDFWSADGSMMFMPEDNDYLSDTGFVSAEVADDFGNFTENPSITLQFEAGYVYYGLIVYFEGNPPQELAIQTYFEGNAVDSFTRGDLTAGRNIIGYSFGRFDKITITFTKATPNNRVLVSKVTFGDLSDYVLRLMDNMTYPVGVKEEKVSSVSVRVFTYTQEDDKDPKAEDDNHYVTVDINPSGSPVTFENPLVTTEKMAQDIAEWLAFYYKNNVAYSTDFRGEPRIDAGDIIFMESEVLDTLQVEVSKHTFTFNGAFGGKLELRRAMKSVEV